MLFVTLHFHYVFISLCWMFMVLPNIFFCFVLCVLTKPIMKTIRESDVWGITFSPPLVYSYWFCKKPEYGLKVFVWLDFGCLCLMCDLQSSKALKI